MLRGRARGNHGIGALASAWVLAAACAGEGSGATGASEGSAGSRSASEDPESPAPISEDHPSGDAPSIAREDVLACRRDEPEACLRIGATLAPRNLSRRRARLEARVRGTLHTARALARAGEQDAAAKVHERIVDEFSADDDGLPPGVHSAAAWSAFALAEQSVRRAEKGRAELQERGRELAEHKVNPTPGVSRRFEIDDEIVAVSRAYRDAARMFIETSEYGHPPVAVAGHVRAAEIYRSVLFVEAMAARSQRDLRRYDQRALEMYERAAKAAETHGVSSDHASRARRLVGEYRADGFPGRIDGAELDARVEHYAPTAAPCAPKFSPREGGATVEVDVSRFGTVVEARGATPRARCVAAMASNWLFPSPDRGPARISIAVDVDGHRNAVRRTRRTNRGRAATPPSHGDPDFTSMRTGRGVAGGVAGGVVGGVLSSPSSSGRRPGNSTPSVPSTVIALRRERDPDHEVPSFDWVIASGRREGAKHDRIAYEVSASGDTLRLVNASWPKGAAKAVKNRCPWLRDPGRRHLGTASLEGASRRIAIRRCRPLWLAELTVHSLVSLAIGDRLRDNDAALHRGERVDLGEVIVQGRPGKTPGSSFRARCRGGEAWLEERYDGAETYVWEEVTCRTRVARPRGAPGPMLRIVDRSMHLLLVVDASSDELLRVMSRDGDGRASAWNRVPRPRLAGSAVPDRDPDTSREFPVDLDLKRVPGSP